MKKYLTSLIAIVFYIMTFIVTTQTPVFATPLVDGFLSADEYDGGGWFDAGWYNGHGKNSVYPEGGTQEDTTGYYYWNSTSENFYLYLAAPLEAKNMIWGDGVTEEEAALYGFKNASDGDFKKMTGSEKLVIGDGFEANLNGDVDNSLYGYTISEHKDSVDYVTAPVSDGGLGYDDKNSYASNTPMAFEFMFEGFDQNDIDDFIAAIQADELGFHLSPERVGESAPVPEPATMLLFGLGLLGLAGVSRKKQ